MGLVIAAGLTLAVIAAHTLPLDIQDAPHEGLGRAALGAMLALYLCQMLLQQCPQILSRWRRWSYAGFYVDELYTRLALRIWPARWTAKTARGGTPKTAATALAEISR
jgi:NAD(P)H-quinone oxidoreductase subunit 5